MSEIRTWSALQFEAFDALKQAWDERREMDAAISAHAGGMQWKTVKGRVYLVRNYVEFDGRSPLQVTRRQIAGDGAPLRRLHARPQSEPAECGAA